MSATAEEASRTVPAVTLRRWATSANDAAHFQCPYCESFEVDRMYLAASKLDSCACMACGARWDEDAVSGEFRGHGPFAHARSSRPGRHVTCLLLPVFDLDGTLLDSDAALVAPFVALGIPAEKVTFGDLLVDECERLGVTSTTTSITTTIGGAQPFPGIDEMIAALDGWAVCSNKHARVRPGRDRAPRVEARGRVVR